MNHSNEIKSVFIDNVAGFLSELKKFKDESHPCDDEKKEKKLPLLWFRGIPDINFHLLPRLFRTSSQHLKDSSEAIDHLWQQAHNDETYYLKSFKIRNYHLIEKLPENDLTWMIIMQHYDVPTRLLDWTESAIAALFFALSDEFSNKQEHTGKIPCVWVLKPLELNRCTKRHYHLDMDTETLPDMLSTFERRQDKTSELIRTLYYPGSTPENHITEILKDREIYPLAINAPYNNERIRAQSGVFTLFSMNPFKNMQHIDEISMEALADAGSYLRRFMLTRPCETANELKTIGVKRSQFFPEMPSISYDIEQELYKTF